MEQLVDVPVPHGRGRGRRLLDSLPRQSSTASGVEQLVDSSSGGVQGFSPGHGSGQRSAEQNADIPIPLRGGSEGLRGHSPGHGCGHRSAEQNVDISVPFDGRPLRGFHTGQGSAAFTEQLVDTGDLQGSLPRQGSRARRGARVRGGGAQGSVPGQGSTALRGAQSCVGRQSRRFSGRIWTLLAVGEYGFIESDSAKAAFRHALVGDVPFLIKGSLRLHDLVTFSVGEGPDGPEAFDLEAVGRE